MRGGRHRIVLAALAGLAVGIVIPCARAAASPRLIGAPLVLRGAAGQTVSTRDFRGRFLLIYFGYTGCPDQCPLTMAAIAGAMRLLGSQAAMVQPLFITIDPTRDSPAVVGNYARLFSHRIIGLTGSADAIGRAEAAFHVYVGTPDPKTGSIPHSSLLYVMGPHGRFRTALSGDLPAPKLAGALIKLLSSPDRRADAVPHSLGIAAPG